MKGFGEAAHLNALYRHYSGETEKSREETEREICCSVLIESANVPSAAPYLRTVRSL